jgi:hypothetical protein
MIRLNDEYQIGFDSMNVTLYRKVKRTEKAKNPDEEKFNVVGYFGSFEFLVNKLLEDKILHGDYNDLEDIKKEIINFKKDILNKIIELKADKTPYKYELESD